MSDTTPNVVLYGDRYQGRQQGFSIGGQTVQALREVNLTINKGEFRCA